MWCKQLFAVLLILSLLGLNLPIVAARPCIGRTSPVPCNFAISIDGPKVVEERDRVHLTCTADVELIDTDNYSHWYLNYKLQLSKLAHYRWSFRQRETEPWRTLGQDMDNIIIVHINQYLGGFYRCEIFIPSVRECCSSENWPPNYSKIGRNFQSPGRYRMKYNGRDGGTIELYDFECCEGHAIQYINVRKSNAGHSIGVSTDIVAVVIPVCLLLVLGVVAYRCVKPKMKNTKEKNIMNNPMYEEPTNQHPGYSSVDRERSSEDDDHTRRLNEDNCLMISEESTIYVEIGNAERNTES